MSSLFKYSVVLRTIKAREHCHRLKKEKKKMFKQEETDCKKMWDFKAQINLAEREQQKLFSEKAVKRDFEMIITSDEKEKKKKKKNEK
ncbi:uncharacterized protein BDCG_16363 [Blastomyces dermatitidis ER-3]|uniref:Uncharacterized protein n=1 Tax=Ajellomyces dermatitidis (strain ER-3 / ATCC MYA-2586) TaxID=559297 RepID=A0ABX2VSB4_AJEDR|nr:uncharacterized protein BDCG_16363 [Blastomyces dermatitidis ER-3]OAS99876.1 hypothetical protein BDCG_16363 [Blastomyces dermatitidis ER-3]